MGRVLFSIVNLLEYSLIKKRMTITLFFLLLSGAAFAGITGKIKGKIVDENGEPLPGANVILEGTNRGAATDKDGEYILLSIDAGTYAITVNVIGYSAITKTNVIVHPDRTTILNFNLTQEVIGMDAVKVYAEKPLVELDRTFSEYSITSEDINRSVMVKSVSDLISLAPGMDIHGSGRIRGGDMNSISADVVYYVDGVKMVSNDGLSLNNYTGVGKYDIESISIITGGLSAEYGNAQAGVVNIITGAGETGAAIVNHPEINKIAFTGSTQVGKIINKTVAGTQKKVTLELGGKAANIIFEDAAIDQAVEGIVNGIYFNQGHVCCAGSRLFVQESIFETVVKKLKHRLESLIVGDPLDKNTDVGAINSKEQLKTINDYIEIGKQEGALMYQSSCTLPSKGNWCKPTLFLNVSQSHTIAQEEIFGPVLAIQTFRTIEEVISKANNTPYGLSAGVWTDKGSKIFNLTHQLQAGVIWANTYNKFDPASPFGGYKESGLGREGGLHGLAAYLNLK